MPSRYFIQSADWCTETTTGSVNEWEVEADKASWVPVVDGKAIIEGAGRANCFLAFSNSVLLQLLIFIHIMIWNGAYIPFDNIYCCRSDPNRMACVKLSKSHVLREPYINVVNV